MKTISGRPLRAMKVAESMNIGLISVCGSARGRLFELYPAWLSRRNRHSDMIGVLDLPETSVPTVRVLTERSLPRLAFFAQRLSREFGMPIRLIPS